MLCDLRKQDGMMSSVAAVPTATSDWWTVKVGPSRERGVSEIHALKPSPHPTAWLSSTTTSTACPLISINSHPLVFHTDLIWCDIWSAMSSPVRMITPRGRNCGSPELSTDAPESLRRACYARGRLQGCLRCNEPGLNDGLDTEEPGEEDVTFFLL